MAGVAQPTLFLLAGPNGAGKSTLYADRIKPITRAPFVNADEIAREWQLQGIDADAYAASREATAQRQSLTDQRRSFVTETVFSHPSKLKLVETALAAGYRVALYHVNVRRPEMSIARVAARVAVGGHRVPQDKIRERYERNPPLIRRAAPGLLGFPVHTMSYWNPTKSEMPDLSPSPPTNPTLRPRSIS